MSKRLNITLSLDIADVKERYPTARAKTPEEKTLSIVTPDDVKKALEMLINSCYFDSMFEDCELFVTANKCTITSCAWDRPSFELTTHQRHLLRYALGLRPVVGSDQKESTRNIIVLRVGTEEYEAFKTVVVNGLALKESCRLPGYKQFRLTPYGIRRVLMTNEYANSDDGTVIYGERECNDKA